MHTREVMCLSQVTVSSNGSRSTAIPSVGRPSARLYAKGSHRSSEKARTVY